MSATVTVRWPAHAAVRAGMQGDRPQDERESRVPVAPATGLKRFRGLGAQGCAGHQPNIRRQQKQQQNGCSIG